MEENQTAGERFTCNICAKNCGSKKSQLRHISYCRRSRYRVRSRKRACLVCTKAKTHCDLAYPSCSRCTAKNLACDYEQHRLPNTPVDPPHQSADQSVEVALTSSSTTPLDFASQMAIYGDAGSHCPLPSLSIDSAETVSSDSSGYGRWHFDSTSIVSQYMEGATARTTYQYGPPSPSSQGLPYIEPSSFVDLSNIEVMHNNMLFNGISPKAPKIFWPWKVRDNQFSLSRNYVLCTLRSYPLRMLPGDTLPPFIHPQCFPDVSGDDRVARMPLPEPLATCAAIIQMFSVKNESNAIFMWKAVRMEQERLQTEYLQYDDWDAVAALQAVTVYLLLRLSEDNDEVTNFDIPLISTMIQLAVQVNGVITKHGCPSDGSTPTWKGWILAESLRRTIIVLFLIDFLFDIYSSLPAYRCDGSMLAGLTLPCARKLWKATTSAEWEKEYTARRNNETGRQQPTYGDLLNFRNKQDRSLDSWLSQLDDFGTLIMAAASTPY